MTYDEGDWNGLNKVVGRPIKDVSQTERGLRFDFADGTHQDYDAEGDCCSHSWVEHLSVPSNVEGAVVTEIRDSDSVAGEDNEDDGEYVTVYHTSFVTDRGEIIVEFRNASNGYYGGYLQAVPS